MTVPLEGSSAIGKWCPGSKLRGESEAERASLFEGPMARCDSLGFKNAGLEVSKYWLIMVEGPSRTRCLAAVLEVRDELIDRLQHGDPLASRWAG